MSLSKIDVKKAKIDATMNTKKNTEKRVVDNDESEGTAKEEGSIRLIARISDPNSIIPMEPKQPRVDLRSYRMPMINVAIGRPMKPRADVLMVDTVGLTTVPTATVKDI